MTVAQRGLRALLAAWAAAMSLAGQAAFSAAYQEAEQLRLGEGSDPGALRDAYSEALEEFVRLPPAQAETATWLPSGAFCAYLAGRPELAVSLFEKSIAAGNCDAFHAEYLLLAQLDAGRHVELLRRARELAEGFPEAVDRVLIVGGGLTQARAWLVADGWLRRGDAEAGLWVFRQLARGADDHPDALANLGLALRHVGRETEAEAVYRRALAAAPDDPSLWNDLGLLFKGAGRTGEAEQALLRSRQLESEPPTGAATTNLVWLGLRTGRRPLAHPEVALAALLAERPDAELARRAYLEVLGLSATPFPASVPDKGEKDR